MMHIIYVKVNLSNNIPNIPFDYVHLVIEGLFVLHPFSEIHPHNTLEMQNRELFF